MSDPDIVVLENVLSPNKDFRILIYQFDAGAFGYSRVFWAVTPEATQGVNISKFILPDGYRAEGWTEQNELTISEWQPYYHIQDAVELRTGDSLHGVKVEVIVNDSNYPLGKPEKANDGKGAIHTEGNHS